MRHLTAHLVFVLLLAAPLAAQDDLMAGYLGVPMKKVPTEFGGGYSMYVAAWPLLDRYPGSRFQTGLFGTWMFAENEGLDHGGKNYSDIEGGLGWWRDTRFATETPKFIMGGVALGFSAWANGPGAGKGRDWARPQGKYAVAQLSPWVLWPPDGLNLAQGTCGELFGYGYLPLPLAEARPKTEGREYPTGDQCWTLFLATANFKGPVAFFTPHFFARSTAERPDLHGKLLDARPADPNRQIQMETQYVPSTTRADGEKRLFARVAATRFPVDAKGDSVLVHRVTSYRRAALADAVAAWFAGGEAVSGRVADEESVRHEFTGKGWSSWHIKRPGGDSKEKIPVDWSSFATPHALDAHTFGYRWDEKLVARTDEGRLVRLPRYYELDESGRKPRWVPRAAGEVPVRRALDEVAFAAPKRRPAEPYVTPEDGVWKKPGPVAGPFEIELGDGSVVTYAWFRFADQPAILNAGLTDEERERMQERVELLHRHWTKDRDYLAPPTRGTLASLDPALVVAPPKGLEIGHVPIVIRQGPRK
ncbi:MAG: hypothetical protein R3F20_15650 [Planctomycetota bacterium]